ncbi:MAG: hypothetical protein RLZZ628_3137 [Bacteroidota bacterium]|jgi:hypothetical protein
MFIVANIMPYLYLCSVILFIYYSSLKTFIMVKANSVLVQEVSSKRTKTASKLVQSIAKTNTANAAKKMANMKAVQALESAIESFPAEGDRTEAEMSAVLQLEAEIEGRLRTNIEIDFQSPEFAVLSTYAARIVSGQVWSVPAVPASPALPA